MQAEFRYKAAALAVIAAILLLSGFIFSGDALAQDAVGQSGITQESESLECAVETAPDGSQRKVYGLTNRLITCVEVILRNIVDIYFGVMRTSMAKFVTGLLTIYITLFAIRVVFGQVKAWRDVGVVMFTMLFVLYMTLNVGLESYTNTWRGIQEGVVWSVTQSLLADDSVGPIPVNDPTPAGELPCARHRTPEELNGGPYFKVPSNIWQMMDCTMASFLGAGPNMLTGGILNPPFDPVVDPFMGLEGLARSMVAFTPFLIAYALTFAPVIGPIINMLIVVIPFSFISAIMQGILTYITSLIVITFLAMLGPIVIPCMLFPWTKRIFEQWWNMIIGYTIQPAIMLAYIAFMIHTVDYVISGPEGLKEQYERYTVNNQDDTTGQRLATTCVKNEPTGQCASETAQDLSGGAATESSGQLSAGAEEASFAMPEAKLGDTEEAHESAVRKFVRGLLTSLLLIQICLGFMDNVVQIGNSLTGLAARPVGKVTQFYTRANTNVAKTLEQDQQKREAIAGGGKS